MNKRTSIKPGGRGSSKTPIYINEMDQDKLTLTKPEYDHKWFGVYKDEDSDIKKLADFAIEFWKGWVNEHNTYDGDGKEDLVEILDNLGFKAAYDEMGVVTLATIDHTNEQLRK